MGAGRKGSEIYLEFIAHGGFVKATAIDPVTGTEASVVGPARGSREALTQAALAKLAYVLKKGPARPA